MLAGTPPWIRAVAAEDVHPNGRECLERSCNGEIANERHMCEFTEVATLCLKGGHETKASLRYLLQNWISFELTEMLIR